MDWGGINYEKREKEGSEGKGQSVMIHIRHVTEKPFLRLLTRFFFYNQVFKRLYS